MWKKRILALIILILALGVALFVYKSEYKTNKNFGSASPALQKYQFRLGLDLSGGSHLVYKADVSAVPEGEVADSMDALRDVIERRVNLFGIAEPVVQVQRGNFVSGGEERLIVELPGITDIDKAVKMIGETPLLEFRIESSEDLTKNLVVGEDGVVNLDFASSFTSTELTGRYLKKAILEFDINTREPMVSLQFDDTGTKLFSDITRENVGKMVAIYLDGSPISTPVVREEIPDGQAIISGSFTPDEAKTLVGRLNSGALPVPITLVSTQTIGASLGEQATDNGLKAGLISFIILSAFFILWYRLPGIVAVISLGIYIVLMLALFKLIPITLTASGIAGLIISFGVAVDANILIFERIKEEMKLNQSIAVSIKQGFDRAWFSIRDANLTTLIASIILFWFGTSSIQGFALVFGLGIIVSMFSAIIVSRYLLQSLEASDSKVMKFLFSSGLSK